MAKSNLIKRLWSVVDNLIIENLSDNLRERWGYDDSVRHDVTPTLSMIINVGAYSFFGSQLDNVELVKMINDSPSALIGFGYGLVELFVRSVYSPVDDLIMGSVPGKIVSLPIEFGYYIYNKVKEKKIR